MRLRESLTLGGLFSSNAGDPNVNVNCGFLMFGQTSSGFHIGDGINFFDIKE